MLVSFYHGEHRYLQTSSQQEIEIKSDSLIKMHFRDSVISWNPKR